nr:MAG TPA: hypothetical protein [Caudoviricetes sp.]
MKKGYKAYEKGLVCRGKQYKIGEIFEEDRAEACLCGMHYCENPLDCLDHYSLIDNEGNFVEMTEVEDLDEENRDTENSKKYCTQKLKIGAKLSLCEMIKAGLEFLFESKERTGKIDNKDDSKLASSGNGSQLASSGDYSKLASSGYGSQLASSGDYSKLASSGDDSKLASSGDYSQLASSGNGSKLASSGNGSQLASSGYYSAVANIGINGMAKAAKYSWITLAEHCWEDGRLKLKCVKTEQVDGDRIKSDTWYKLQDGEFKEV